MTSAADTAGADEEQTVREFSLPALYEVPAKGSLTDLVRRNAAQHPDTPVLARRTGEGWREVTAERFEAEVRAVAKGLIASGVQAGDRVALLCGPGYEWTLLDFAAWAAGAVTVPLYGNCPAEEIAWILGDAGAVACLVDSAARQERVEAVRDRLPRLERLWRIDAGAVPDLAAAGAEVPDGLLEDRAALTNADSPASVVYTAGSTGRPKGCVLTHRSFFAASGNLVARLTPLFRTGESSVLMLLPPAHHLGRLMQVGCLMAPVRLGHAGDPEDPGADPAADLASFRPTLVVGVPRVFERLYHQAGELAAERGMGRVFDSAARTAIAYSRALDRRHGPNLPLRLRHRVFDRLVYRRLRAVLGGRASHAISGGAALGERLGHFFRGTGLTVLEGYGLAESCGVTALSPWDRAKVGTVGQPLPGTVLRISDDGEVLLHGEHLFAGYWNNEAAGSAALSDGWFHTGDLGTLDEDGYLSVGGRKEEVIVTAQGAAVCPAVVEDRLRGHALVAECMVVGAGRPFLGALITLDEEFLARWVARRHLAAPATAAALHEDPELRAAVQQAVDDANAALPAGVALRRFRILPGRLTEEAGHLTPSGRLRRDAVSRDHAAQIEELFAV